MLGSIATNRTSFDGVYVPGPNNTNQQINEHNIIEVLKFDN